MRSTKIQADQAMFVTIELPADNDGDIAKLFLRPWGAAVRLAAGRAYIAAAAMTGVLAICDVAYTIGALKAALVGWEGFDVDVTPGSGPIDDELLEGVAADIEEDFEAFTVVDKAYVRPALKREAEKNASSLSPAGGSPGAAKTVANPSSTAGAAATTAPPAKRGAKAARSTTGSRDRKPAT